MKAKSCRWCRVPMRECEVLAGPSPGRPVTMYLDTDPHTEGEVIARDDGQLRLLAVPERRRPVAPTYRIHSRHNCAPKGRSGEPIG